MAKANKEVKEVAVKKPMEVTYPENHRAVQSALPPSNADEFFDEAVVTDSNDIMIPRILLMHGTSTLVGQEKARQGDIIDSISHEVLANSKKAIEFIPIKQLDKAWSIEKYTGKKYEFERTDPWDPTLANQLEFEEGGEKKRRNARLSFYVLLARDCGSNHLPYMVSFQRTSYKAGKNIASFFQEALFAFKKGDKTSIPMGQVFELGCHVEQRDDNSYYVMNCKRHRIAAPEELDKGKYWFSQLRSKTYKVHDESEVATPEPETQREY